MRIDLDKRRETEGAAVVRFKGKDYVVRKPRLRDLAIFDKTDDYSMKTIKQVICMLFGDENWEVFNDLEVEEFHEIINNCVPGAGAGAGKKPKAASGGNSDAQP